MPWFVFVNLFFVSGPKTLPDMFPDFLTPALLSGRLVLSTISNLFCFCLIFSAPEPRIVICSLVAWFLTGYPAPPPTPFFEPNNQSALQHLPQLRETLAAWLRDGFVEELTYRLYCCNPLTVVVQHNAITNTTKYRPCIDLSCHVNKFIVHSPAKLDDLSIAEHLIAAGDFMAAFDLKNQFFQVRLAPATKTYFSFSVPDASGRHRFYQFTVMAYGCKPAVSVIIRLLKPLKSFLHRHGVKFSVYVDDSCISANYRSHLCLTLHTLHLAGWKIQWKKTVTSPSQQLLHLGFINRYQNLVVLSL
jgi:Reverse transcriptase (RNA-dependent DNA polymerase)